MQQSVVNTNRQQLATVASVVQYISLASSQSNTCTRTSVEFIGQNIAARSEMKRSISWTVTTQRVRSGLVSQKAAAQLSQTLGLRVHRYFVLVGHPRVSTRRQLANTIHQFHRTMLQQK